MTRTAVMVLALIVTPALAQPQPDVAYGAYQRGHYLTAFAEATKHAQTDPKAMTLLGDLYANGLGVGRDDKKAADWFKLAADRGDTAAMFSLALLRLDGRGVPKSRLEASKLFEAAANKGHVAAAYNLGLMYLEGQEFPRDLSRAAELFRVAARAGNPEAQYALATMHKEGRGIAKDEREAAQLLEQAARANNVDAMVEFSIMQFNGTGTTKNEAAAVALMRKAAQRGSPIAQNRLARALSAGRGVPADPVQAIRWHLIAKAGGAGDLTLDDFAAKQKPEVRSAAEEAAKPWLASLQRPKP